MRTCEAVLAIYARENGAGTVFAPEGMPADEAESDSAPVLEEAKTDAEVPPQTPPKPRGKPNLKVIK